MELRNGKNSSSAYGTVEHAREEAVHALDDGLPVRVVANAADAERVGEAHEGSVGAHDVGVGAASQRPQHACAHIMLGTGTEMSRMRQ